MAGPTMWASMTVLRPSLMMSSLNVEYAAHLTCNTVQTIQNSISHRNHNSSTRPAARHSENRLLWKLALNTGRESHLVFHLVTFGWFYWLTLIYWLSVVCPLSIPVLSGLVCGRCLVIIPLTCLWYLDSSNWQQTDDEAWWVWVIRSLLFCDGNQRS